MVGILIAGHAGLARDLLRTAEMITGRVEKIAAVAIKPEDDRSAMPRKFTRAIKKVDSKDGVLLLSDIYGGSASNVARSLQKQYRLRIVTGVNLPMILEMMVNRSGSDLDGLAMLAERTGKKSILRADRLAGQDSPGKRGKR